jgi:hypothetical protein
VTICKNISELYNQIHFVINNNYPLFTAYYRVRTFEEKTYGHIIIIHTIPNFVKNNFYTKIKYYS